MKKLVLLFLFGCINISSIHANPIASEHLRYGSIGSIGGYPTIGGGYRMQRGYHGFDISGKFLPCVVAEMRGSYLFYPKQGSFYLGAGLGGIWEGEILHSGSLSCHGLAGYQWLTKKGKKLFFEVEGIAPFKNYGYSPVWPGFFTFGICF